ncbi:response regulator [Xanthomonas pisi]|uniref:Two-component system response regulator n=1 Tax=Xanthomonas pisi TaxID=56457 RepID=A0A2S7D6S0_9XANT|nr:response regulator [Xanthomonas pisi]PPU69523.1 two-component system response regulator [Xanthomonas pisi]
MTESLRLLMVEDQEELRELIGEALRDAGITVDTADDAQGALRMLRDSGPYDVVFSDIRMPNGMSGIELSEQVAQLLPQARVILASGFAKAQLPPLPAGVDFLPKPYRLRQLIDMLKGIPANA